MRILKWSGVALGNRLWGEELPTPADWSVCNDHVTIAVETRPDDVWMSRVPPG